MNAGRSVLDYDAKDEPPTVDEFVDMAVRPWRYHYRNTPRLKAGFIHGVHDYLNKHPEDVNRG